MLRKKQAENSLLYFTRLMFKARYNSRFIVNWHHSLIASEFEALVNGTSMSNVGTPGRTEILILNMPPRYTKTEMAVVNFVPWVLAKNPAAKFIHTSYSDDLVLHNSEQAREIIAHEQYQELWPTVINPSVDSKGLWLTSDSGGLYAVPSRGTITGFGAGVTEQGAWGDKFGGAILIDDPLKPDDAKSDAMRGAVNERLLTTIISRRNSRETPIVLIMQRLHEDDMTGFILAGKTGMRVRHVKIQALTDAERVPGDEGALWPYKHTAEELRSQQMAEPYVFSGQMQQDPSPSEGEYFKRSWIRYYVRPGEIGQPGDAVLPEHLNKYGASDYAVSEAQGDFTEHGVSGVDAADDMYVLDWWYGQKNSLESVNAWLDMVERHKIIAWAQEKGPILRAIEPLMSKRMEERKLYVYIVPYTSSRGSQEFDKEMRAQSIRGRFAQGKVLFPRHAPWVPRLIDQLLKFPKGKLDDGVDVLSLKGRMLADMRGKKVPPAEKPPVFENKITLDDLWDENENDQGRTVI